MWLKTESLTFFICSFQLGQKLDPSYKYKYIDANTMVLSHNHHRPPFNYVKWTHKDKDKCTYFHIHKVQLLIHLHTKVLFHTGKALGILLLLQLNDHHTLIEANDRLTKWLVCSHSFFKMIPAWSFSLSASVRTATRAAAEQCSLFFTRQYNLPQTRQSPQYITWIVEWKICFKHWKKVIKKNRLKTRRN